MTSFFQEIQIEKKSIKKISRIPNRKEINSGCFVKFKQKRNELRNSEKNKIEKK